ncbi:tyrosine protein-kinase src-2-like isoform X2 [Portunus trituberculatus]|uniref:tyrosine protein-kinase src-2-like isoform X2 n=1 Tax=Portunus trituberculatus TaxID=210409 RepID=UPI001E1D068E|nr:tyrosine protein-kinase src-2-like isoform X2 [Portunus trituberculatus]
MRRGEALIPRRATVLRHHTMSKASAGKLIAVIWNSLRLLAEITSGIHRQVWSGKWKESVEVEIKTTDMKKGAKECLEKVELLRGLHHPNLLNLLGVCTEGHQVHVVSEGPFSAQNLQFWLSRYRQVCLPLHLHVLSQVASGMAYLEEHDLLYFDLAVREILMTSDLVCKLRVCLSISTPQHVTSEDSLRFAPVIPELSACGSVTSKTCVWLFGMFMVEVVKGSPLHCHEYASNKDIVEQLRKGHGVPPPANCPKELYTLMKKCWIPSPEKRPSFAFLRNSLQEAAAGYTEEDVRMCLQDSSVL